MSARWWFLVAAVHAVGCAHHVSPPPPPLPAPPLPLLPDGLSSTMPTSLESAFQSCRAASDRAAQPGDRLAGRAVIAARIDTTGAVLWATAARIEALPQSVVMCLLDRVRATRFPPREDRVDVRIPVDFTRAAPPPDAALQL